MSSLSDKELQKLKEELPKKVGDRVVFFRQSKNMTQTELAQKVSKDRQYIYKIEKGKVTPNIITLSIICKALSIKLTDLLKDVD